MLNPLRMHSEKRQSPGKTALVTGASSGIGAATARRLLDDGWRVVAAARRVERMAPLAEAGAETRFLDLADEESIESLAGEMLDRFGRIDALVNNAGIGVYGSVEETPLAEAREQFEVNLFGHARLAQLLLPAMREAGGGTVVVLSSMGGRSHTPLGAWYHASKHALEGWADSLRFELAPFGVRVVVVEPGAVQTEFCEGVVAPLLRRSGEGPYAGLAQRMAEATESMFRSGKATSPERVAAVVARALEAERPRTRYVVGHLARPVMLLRRVAGDRVYDWILRRGLR